MSKRIETRLRYADTLDPSEGVIGYDFFNNFTLVIDRVGGKMTCHTSKG